MIAAMRACPMLRRERTPAAAPPAIRSISPDDTRALAFFVFISRPPSSARPDPDPACARSWRRPRPVARERRAPQARAGPMRPPVDILPGRARSRRSGMPGAMLRRIRPNHYPPGGLRLRPGGQQPPRPPRPPSWIREALLSLERLPGARRGERTSGRIPSVDTRSSARTWGWLGDLYVLPVDRSRRRSNVILAQRSRALVRRRARPAEPAIARPRRSRADGRTHPVASRALFTAGPAASVVAGGARPR